MRFARASGILLHPTSLPGPFGCGDLGPSAYHFVDWLCEAGQRLWQVLPLGPIGPGNSPYSSASAFAGNPLLVDLHELATHGWLADAELVRHPPLGHRRVDYAGATRYRMAALERAAQAFFGRHDDPLHAAFDAFCACEAVWLDDYALFMALSASTNGNQWNRWPLPLRQRQPQALAHAVHELRPSLLFWQFVQWCFFRQWRALKDYANKRDVRIVGDMPIFVALESAEVWSRPHLFELDDDLIPTVVAGVPPDYFSVIGQRWGNPLYRWEAMEREGYAWWTARFGTLSELVDIVRIDHFRGFASYWRIPATAATAVAGVWAAGPGEKLFAAVEAALGRLPIIAEDLGTRTPDVTELLNRLRFPGMRILQFAFSGDARNTYLPHNYEPNTVVYTGTHDNDTTRGWYDQLDAERRDHVNRYLATDGNEIHWALIRAAALSVADLAIYPMQDVLGLGSEERMNMPGEASSHWEWRFTWDQVHPWQAERLYEIAALSGRCAADRLRWNG